MLEDLCAGTLAEDDLEKFKRVEDSSILSKIMSVQVSAQDALSSRSRTSKIWVRYMQYIDVIKYFIRAERRDWLNHLAATKMMLNLDDATGRHNYVISACLYLQMMDKWNILGNINCNKAEEVEQYVQKVSISS